MGCRLHSATKYEVEYSSKAVFNHASHVINPIITILSEEDYWANDDYIGNATQLEASRENLVANVDKIMNPDEDWEWQEELDGAIETMEKHSEINREYLYKELKSLIDDAEKKDDYIHFSWFYSFFCTFAT